MNDKLVSDPTAPLTWWTEPFVTDWIAAVSAFVSAVAVVLALLYARKEISAWRNEARGRRRAQVAEDVLAAAHNADDVIRSLRSPMDSVPVEKIKDRTYTYKRRYERMVERGEIFEALRYAQIRAKAVLRDDRVDAAIEKIFRVRMDFMFALEDAVDSVTGEQDLDPNDREFLQEQRKMIFGRFNENDELHVTLTDALNELDKILGPVARFEVSNAKV